MILIISNKDRIYFQKFDNFYVNNHDVISNERFVYNRNFKSEDLIFFKKKKRIEKIRQKSYQEQLSQTRFFAG